MNFISIRLSFVVCKRLIWLAHGDDEKLDTAIVGVEKSERLLQVNRGYWNITMERMTSRRKNCTYFLAGLSMFSQGMGCIHMADDFLGSHPSGYFFQNSRQRRLLVHVWYPTSGEIHQIPPQLPWGSILYRRKWKKNGNIRVYGQIFSLLPVFVFECIFWFCSTFLRLIKDRPGCLESECRHHTQYLAVPQLRHSDQGQRVHSAFLYCSYWEVGGRFSQVPHLDSVLRLRVKFNTPSRIFAHGSFETGRRVFLSGNKGYDTCSRRRAQGNAFGRKGCTGNRRPRKAGRGHFKEDSEWGVWALDSAAALAVPLSGVGHSVLLKQLVARPWLFIWRDEKWFQRLGSSANVFWALYGLLIGCEVHRVYVG